MGGTFKRRLLIVLFIEALRFLSCKEMDPLLSLEAHTITVFNWLHFRVETSGTGNLGHPGRS